MYIKHIFTISMIKIFDYLYGNEDIWAIAQSLWALLTDKLFFKIEIITKCF